MSILRHKYQTRDRWINIILAISSSSSIATWAVWDDYDFVWGGIIVVSQVINAVKHLFPYKKSSKAINQASQKLDLITIEYELLWNDLQYQNITIQKAFNQHINLKRKVSELLNFSDEIILKASKKEEEKANKSMRNFLNSDFNIGIELNDK